jgi:hypothetical protein
MKLEAIKNVVTSQVARKILLSKKHSPTILFGAGVVGVVGATVLACKATLRLEDILDESQRDHELARTLEHRNYSEDDRKSDHVKITLNTAARVVRLYSPAILVGTASIAALTGSHVTLSKRNAGLMAAYSALDKGFKEYRTRVREELGEEKDLEFRHGTDTVIETVEGKNGPKEVERTVVPAEMPSMYARFFDESSTEWSRQPEYNQAFLGMQQTWFNDLLRTRGHVFLNEVYDRLGFERTKAGQHVGWVMAKGGDNYIDFGIYNGNERSRAFVNRNERSILLDFNVDGVILDLI